MATHKALPKVLARIDERHLVPAVSTFTVSGLAVLYYLGLALLSADPLGASIDSITLVIAFYYALTAFACVWYFRRRLLNGGLDLLTKGLLPLLGGLILLGAFIARASHIFSSSLHHSLPALLGVGFLLLGWLLMAVYSLFVPEYFRSGGSP
jgi:amino acid transporter